MISILSYLRLDSMIVGMRRSNTMYEAVDFVPIPAKPPIERKTRAAMTFAVNPLLEQQRLRSLRVWRLCSQQTLLEPS